MNTNADVRRHNAEDSRKILGESSAALCRSGAAKIISARIHAELQWRNSAHARILCCGEHRKYRRNRLCGHIHTMLPQHMHRESYTIAAEQSAIEVENHEPFGAKWSMFCRLKVRSYVLAANVAGTLKVAPLQILKFPVVLPHKFLDAEKFDLRFSDASEITEIADKLRWSLVCACSKVKYSRIVPSGSM